MIADKENKGWVLDSTTGRYKWTYGNAQAYWKPFEGAGGGIVYSEGNVPSFVKIAPDGKITTPDVIITP